MSGIGGSEFILLCLIGLMILGPERLPRVARQLGSWVGKARQMTRSLQRQLEDETSVEKNFGFDPKEMEKQLDPSQMITPRDDDTYSPLHDEEDEEPEALNVKSEADEDKKDESPA